MKRANDDSTGSEAKRACHEYFLNLDRANRVNIPVPKEELAGLVRGLCGVMEHSGDGLRLETPAGVPLLRIDMSQAHVSTYAREDRAKMLAIQCIVCPERNLPESIWERPCMQLVWGCQPGGYPIAHEVAGSHDTYILDTALAMRSHAESGEIVKVHDGIQQWISGLRPHVTLQTLKKNRLAATVEVPVCTFLETAMDTVDGAWFDRAEEMLERV